MTVVAAPLDVWPDAMPLATTSRMLAPFLDRLTDEEIDAIPYGMVQLDPTGTVRSFTADTGLPAGMRLKSDVVKGCIAQPLHLGLERAQLVGLCQAVAGVGELAGHVEGDGVGPGEAPFVLIDHVFAMGALPPR